MNIKILLVDDHTMFRDGLRSMIEMQPDMSVTGEAGDGRTAVQMHRELKPDLVIMDIVLPGLNGIDATRQILAQSNSTRVLILSMHSEARFVAETLKAGASAYLLKEDTFDELVRAIRAVNVGQIFLSPTITGIVVEGYKNHQSDFKVSLAKEISLREREVLQLLAEGATTKEIADKLGVSPKTIETHRLQIMAKLGVKSLAALVKYAVREGLTSL